MRNGELNQEMGINGLLPKEVRMNRKNLIIFLVSALINTLLAAVAHGSDTRSRCPISLQVLLPHGGSQRLSPQVSLSAPITS